MSHYRISLLFAGMLALSGCGDSAFSLNPFNWFGGESEEQSDDDDFQALERIENRPLVEDITSVVTETLPGGILVRATGVPTTQGWYDAELVPELVGEATSSTLVYSFRARPPEDTAFALTVRSREIVVARFVSEVELLGISQIRVVGEASARSVRP